MDLLTLHSCEQKNSKEVLEAWELMEQLYGCWVETIMHTSKWYFKPCCQHSKMSDDSKKSITQVNTSSKKRADMFICCENILFCLVSPTTLCLLSMGLNLLHLGLFRAQCSSHKFPFFHLWYWHIVSWPHTLIMCHWGNMLRPIQFLKKTICCVCKLQSDDSQTAPCHVVCAAGI